MARVGSFSGGYSLAQYFNSGTKGMSNQIFSIFFGVSGYGTIWFNEIKGSDLE